MTRRSHLIVALAIVVLAIWILRPQRDAGSPHIATPSADEAFPPSSLHPQLAAERSTLADALNAPAADPRSDLRTIALILDTFRSNFPRDGNPTGNNAEITAVLTGRNRLRLSLVPADHPAINARGELCDRWDTPYFFHAESATRMSLRSAGPDRQLWTPDDVEHVP